MLVSICIPAYNNVTLFKQCLNSVLIQSFKEYEIIVSDDSTNKEISDYVQELDLFNLKYFHNSPALGSPENWNNAMKQAKGKYIKILHHDDYFTRKESLAKFVAALEKNPKAWFCFSYSSIHFKRKNEFFIHKQTRVQLKRLEQDPGFLFFRNVIGAPSAVFFRNDPAIEFNVNYTWLVDVDFYIRYLKKHKIFAAIAEPLITVVDGEEGQITQQVSHDKKRVISENLNLFSSLYDETWETKKAWLFFQELFVQFEILSFEQLIRTSDIPANITGFLHNVFKDMSNDKWLKAIKKRLLTSRYNKQIFKIERF